jgi:hypothetical protein
MQSALVKVSSSVFAVVVAMASCGPPSPRTAVLEVAERWGWACPEDRIAVEALPHTSELEAKYPYPSVLWGNEMYRVEGCGKKQIVRCDAGSAVHHQERRGCDQTVRWRACYEGACFRDPTNEPCAKFEEEMLR